MIEHTHIILLGLVQGITEFLPISSSAHLILVPVIMGYNDQGLAYDVAAHAGTLLAVLLFCYPYLRHILQGLWHYNKAHYAPARHLLLTLILATLPIVIIGFLSKDIIADYARSPVIIAVSSAIGGGLLLYAHYKKNHYEYSLYHISWKHALYIGLWQVSALIPGMSRSASAIIGARLIGLPYKDALDFAFLLAIPTIFGAIILNITAYIQAINNQQYDILYIMFISFISALAVLTLFKTYITYIGLAPFCFYRIILSITIIMVLYI